MTAEARRAQGDRDHKVTPAKAGEADACATLWANL
jgi:hypothetical protein